MTDNNTDTPTKNEPKHRDLSPAEMQALTAAIEESKKAEARFNDRIRHRIKRAAERRQRLQIEEQERADAIPKAAPGQVMKPAAAVITGYARPDGTRNTIGKIYLHSDMIGARVTCSTIWKEGETIPTGNGRTVPEIIRNEWNPAEVITIIHRIVRQHNAGCKIIGYVSIPREWIGRDVLIKREEETETEPASPAIMEAGK